MKRILLVLFAAVLALPLLSPEEAGAQLASRNVLIKGSGAAVYYLAEDDRRYVFPNAKTYFTWYADFGSVITVSDAELASYPLGGNVTYRPGVKMVKIDTDPKVYAVAKDGTLRWVTSESVAASLYGADWNQKIDDIPDAFFVNYTVGDAINQPSDYDPEAAKAGSPTIAEDKDIGEEEQCTADVWVCTAWSACSASGARTRTCTMTTDCPHAVTPMPAEAEQCEPPQGSPEVGNSDEGIVVGGKSDVVLARFTISAQLEELTVRKLRLKVAPGSASGILSLSLYDGNVEVGGPVSVNASTGHADFSGVNFVVPKNGSNDLTVRAALNFVGPSGAPSGIDLKVALDQDDGFEARGATSGNLYTSMGTGDLEGRSKILRRTRPTVTTVSLSSSTLFNGTVTASRVNVAADSAANLYLRSIKWTIARAGDGVGITAPKVRRAGGSDVAATFDLNGGAGCASGTTACVVTAVFSSQEQISAGSSTTYELLVNVDSAASGDAISTMIADDSALVTGELDSSVGGNVSGDAIEDLDGSAASGTYHFIWSDGSASPHNDAVGTSGGDEAGASNDWTNGHLVLTLATDAQAMTTP